MDRLEYKTMHLKTQASVLSGKGNIFSTRRNCDGHRTPEKKV